MNKKLFIIRNIIFLINVLLFIGLSLIKLCAMKDFNIFFLYLILMIMLIITALDIYKKRKRFNYDSEYNLIFIISNIAIMIILLRGLFDTTIISNTFDPIDYRYANTGKVSFIINNLMYINIIYSSLILYRLTLIKKINVKK